MGITRKFIDWNGPALPAVVDDLRDQYTVLGSCDLSHVVIVLPGGQAGRRLQELLAVRTGGQFTPPFRVMTEGALPELLYVPQRPFASELTQRLAWGQALRSLPSQKLQRLLRQPPGEHEVEAMLALGELLARQHRELAADRLDFADVARLGKDLPGFGETERWEILHEVQTAYLHLLDGLQLWDQQTARLVAINKHECATSKDIVLIGTVDLNGTLRAMLEQVAERVTTYVHAPKSLQKRFDELGCLKPAAWETAEIELDQRRLHVVEGPTQQAETVARVLAGYHGRYAAEEVTVGVPDDRLVPHVRRLLTQCGVPTRWVVERDLPHTEPYLFLLAVAEYLDSGLTTDFAALVRHPDVSAWILQQGFVAGWVTTLDEYIQTHLPAKLDTIQGNDETSLLMQRLRDAVHALLEPLRGIEKPLSDWAGPVTELLLALYNHVEFDREQLEHRSVISACKAIHKALIGHTGVPVVLMPSVTAARAIRLTLEQVSKEIIPAEIAEEAVQVYGWLELALDDAPALVVTSFNEGFVPASVNHDLFLPNRLRTHLGLDDNARRYARDAYALSVILHARRDIDLIVGKLDAAGEPLTPSRLLFAANEEVIAQRVLAFYNPPPQPTPPPLAGPITASLDRFAFEIPRPQLREKEPWSFSVTELATYLESPYRYYLSRVLWLQEMSDQVQELDPAGFGNLLHEVLKEFGTNDIRRSGDPLAIRRFLYASLDRLVAETYGAHPLMPVGVQVEQARARLAAFANWQADWANQGWELRFAEVNPKPHPFKLSDGRTVKIKGRIDRIDFHPERREWAIFDYKTGEKSLDPGKKHRTSEGDWIDLQLPLYRHLARQFGVQGNVRLGYIVIPRDTDDVGHKFGEWNAGELQDADEVAREVIRNILDEVFWPPITDGGRMYEFAPIVQEGVFGREEFT